MLCFLAKLALRFQQNLNFILFVKFPFLAPSTNRNGFSLPAFPFVVVVFDTNQSHCSNKYSSWVRILQRSEELESSFSFSFFVQLWVSWLLVLNQLLLLLLLRSNKVQNTFLVFLR